MLYPKWFRLLTRATQTVPRTCSATASVVEDGGRPCCYFFLRFSNNPAPTPQEMFAPERYVLPPGGQTTVPLVFKTEGETNARAFTRPMHVLGLLHAPAEYVHPIPSGGFVAKVELNAGSPQRISREFRFANEGTGVTGLRWLETGE